MSSNKSAARRLSLMTGSSLVAASLAAFAFAGVALAPSAALAANECGDPTTNGPTADVFDCTGDYGSITYPLTQGNLTLRLQGPMTVTGGIAITPTGANTVTLSRIADVVENSGDPQISNSNGAGISIVRTTSGAVTLNLFDTGFESFDKGDEGITVRGTSAGVYVETVGTAAVNVNFAGGGNVTGVTAGAGGGEVSASAGAGVHVVAAGNAVTVQNGLTMTGTTAAIQVDGGAAVTIRNRFAAGSNPSARLLGRVVLSNTGNTLFTNNSYWEFDGTSTLRSGAVTTGTATLTNGRYITTTGASATIDFGQGVGTFNNDGYLAVGTAPGASTLTLLGADTWNNSNIVIFGVRDQIYSDGEANDRIVLVDNDGTPATFTGSLYSLLVMDVDFTASQSSCAAAVTADCLDLRGHNTAGTTAIEVHTAAQGYTAERIVLVDVAGAGNDDGVFTLSENSTGYRALGDGMVDAGLFLYALSHDTDAQQHVLTVAGVDEEAVEINLVGRAALVGWETATATFFDRQTDVRTTLRAGGGLMPGGWIKVAGNFVNRNMVSQLTLAGDSVDVVTHHNQDTFAVVGGIDLVAFSDDVSAVLIGLTAGQVNSELQFKESPNGMEFDGHSFGAYASYVNPGFFVDGIINSTNMDATFNGSTLGLDLEGDAKSIGYRVEGGLRFDWGDGIWFEPLAALSYVRTDIGDMAVADGVTARFDRFSSLRGSLGARLSGDVEFDGFTLQLAGIGRVWNEFRGEADSRIATGFGDFAFTDVNDGMISELGASLGLFGLGGRLSAQLSSGVKFASEYQSVDVALGARYQW